MIMKKSDSGFELPILGIGTFGIGGDEDSVDNSNDEKNIQAIKDAIDMGYTHIDTAEVYGDGHTEELVGKAIGGYDRKKLFITTKVFKTNLGYEDVIRSAKNSLKRMNIEYIDLYLIHSYNKDIPIEETARAMNELIEEGLIKNVGVCNFNAEQLKEFQKYLKSKIAVNQLKFNLWAKTKPDLEAYDYCQKNDILIVVYKLFGRGKINIERIALISDIAKKYHKTEPQIMINWVISKKNVVVIFKSTNKKHLKENLEALKFQLSKEDIQNLDNLAKN
jgi:diketogulonate reductase-like aldo/keto reductase